jgi:hypothetical protein
MADSSKSSPFVICTSCGVHQPDAAHICANCGAPLTPFAHSDPVLGIEARGFALHKATTRPNKLIVVVGTWIWMVPMFVTGLFFAGIGGSALYYSAQEGRLFEALFGLPCGLLGVLFVYIAGTILYRTTTRYVNRRSGGGDGAEEADSEETKKTEEVETCLKCGKELAPADSRCSACGWSFSGGE